jgi:predicted metal-dependent phosphoesterase TrpH
VPEDTTKALENIKTQAVSALATATSQEEFIKAQQELVKQQQEILKKIQEQQRGWIEKFKNIFIERKPTADIIKEQMEKYGVPETFEKIKALTPEITALNQELANLQARELQEISNIQTNPQFSVQYASREARRVSREYAIKQMGVSAELGAKTALMQAYQGNIATARNLISDVVEAMNYDTNQKLQDIRTFIDMNQDFIDSLEADQKNILNNIQNYWETKARQDRQDYQNQLNLIIDAANKGVNLGIGVEDVKRMSLEDITKLYQTKVSPVIAEREVSKAELEKIGLTIFDDVLQKAIDAGATPQQAVEAAQIYASNLGITLKKEDLGQLLAKAKTLTPTPVSPIPTPSPITPTPEMLGEAVREAPGKIVSGVGGWLRGQIGEIKSFFGGLFGR